MRQEILVVEDEPDIRGLVVLHLEREGFRCRTAANGLDALREAKARRPDLIVLDLMLPGLGGLEVCRRLRSDRETAGVPIIMLTAKADEVDRVVGLELGADDYVVKPFSPKEFDLLHALLESAGRVLSREHLLNHVWGYARADEIESRTVDVHIRRLRAKLGDVGHRIATVKSVGYRFETD